jgi:DNA invertase Pin-like site-specific DNA recombinase
MINAKELKLKGTGLERNRIVTKEMKQLMKELRDEGCTYNEIAAQFGVSFPTVYYHLMDSKARQELKEKNKKAMHDWYHSKSKEEKRIINKRWSDSTYAYKQELINTKINNMEIK